jgi:hypothetical protein
MLARLCALCFVLCVLAGPAAAQERARDFIEPRVSKTQFQQLCQQIGLQSDQRQIANIAFSDYEAALADAATRLDEQALAAGRQSVDDSLSGKARLPAEDLKRLRGEVLKVYVQAGPEADAALDALIGGVEALLTEDQQDKFTAAKRWLHREILLHPRASNAAYQEYAGDGVDVLALVEQARGEGGELAATKMDSFRFCLSTNSIWMRCWCRPRPPAARAGSCARSRALRKIPMRCAARSRRHCSAGSGCMN